MKHVEPREGMQRISAILRSLTIFYQIRELNRSNTGIEVGLGLYPTGYRPLYHHRFPLHSSELKLPSLRFPFPSAVLLIYKFLYALFRTTLECSWGAQCRMEKLWTLLSPRKYGPKYETDFNMGLVSKSSKWSLYNNTVVFKLLYPLS